MAIHNNMQYVHELVLTRSNYEYIIILFMNTLITTRTVLKTTYSS